VVASSQTDQKTERSSNRRQPRSSRDDRVEPKLAEGGKPIENKVAQGEDGGRPRRRRGGKQQRERNERALERDAKIKKDIGVSGEEEKKNGIDTLPKQTSDEVSIDSSVHQEGAKKSEGVRRTRPIKAAINKDNSISEKESKVSHASPDSEKPLVLEETVKAPKSSSAKSAPESKVEKSRVPSESKPKKVSQTAPLSDGKSKGLAKSKLVMVETKQEKNNNLG
jgi:hypothetical protein